MTGLAQHNFNSTRVDATGTAVIPPPSPAVVSVNCSTAANTPPGNAAETAAGAITPAPAAFLFPNLLTPNVNASSQLVGVVTSASEDHALFPSSCGGVEGHAGDRTGLGLGRSVNRPRAQIARPPRSAGIKPGPHDANTLRIKSIPYRAINTKRFSPDMAALNCAMGAA